jgi:hypothetical protein
LRQVLRPILAQHLQVPRNRALDGVVLPGSGDLRSLDLLRG